MARKILLADDSVTAQNMGRKILADAGYEVITVNNGSAALKKIAETKPDLIVLDVYMPGYSGLEVCQRLKEAQETSRIPVLLTVGKLEPFKPEEAKRVRAEGYIVKPFEASELLSALSKLEDKIVPRAEPSKPGRFARANAALDEGRYDKTVAMEEDSGWKNRIGFPSKKKKPAEEEEAEESSIYNAVNKDLRTVVDRKPAPAPQEAKAEDATVDLGALAPEGLPKDVTPEEIAALAAAAAQVKGKLSDSTFSEPSPEPPALAAEVKPAQAPTAEAQFAEARLADVQPAEARIAEAKPAEISAEEKREAKSASEETKEFAAPAATFAAQRPEEQVEASAYKTVEDVKESGSAAPTPAEMMAAIAGLVPETVTSADSSSGNGSGPHTVPDQQTPNVPPDALAQPRSAEEPVTMAAAAGAGFGSSVSRWTAVAATLAPDEAAISLEHEMQKAHAAFAAAEVAHTSFVASVPEAQPVAQAAAEVPISAPVEAAEPAAAPAPASEGIRSELVRDMSVVASAATEAVTAAVKEFEKVAAYLGSQPAAEPQTQAAPEPAPLETHEPVVEPSSEVPPTVETKAEEKPIVEAAAPESEITRTEAGAGEYEKENAPLPVAEPKQEDSKHEEPKQEEPKREDPKQEDYKYQEPASVMAVATPAAEQTPAVIEEKPEITASAFTRETSANQISLEQIVAEQTVAEPNFADQSPVAEQPSASPFSSDAAEHAPTGDPAAGRSKDTAKKESEIAETTAAAWASWRRIRESGDFKATPAELDESKRQTAKEAAEGKTPAPQDAAAMAVAAGAEQSPEEAPAASEDSGDIANIVDSVLADMRPRIVEEISRKLGKKK